VAGLAAALGSAAMTNPILDLEQAGCMFVIGSNTTEAHPIVALAIKRAVGESGAKLVVANPTRIDLCDLADVWLQHRPGTDVALLNGLARIIVEEGWQDKGFIAERTEGFEQWLASLDAYTPEAVQEITGVAPADLYAAAQAYARPPFGASAVVYTLGITLHRTGTDNVLALANLALLTGNFGKPGSGVNPLRGQCNVQGACDMGCLPDFFPGYQRAADPAMRAKFETAWGAIMPALAGRTEPEMMEAAHAGELRAMYVIGENPVRSDADAGHVVAALRKLDFFVVQDIFLTETARLADVVLPATSFAEKDGTFTSTERRVQRLRQAITPVGESRLDWQVVAAVARRVLRLQGRPEVGFGWAGAEEIMREIAGLTPSYGGISYQRLDQGSLQWPCPEPDHPGTRRLHTARFTRGQGRFTPVQHIPPAEMPDDEYPLVLTTGRVLYHFHTSTMTGRVDGLNRLSPAGYVELSEADAADLGLSDGALARVASRRGEVTTKVRLTNDVPPGVVFMPFHFADTWTNLLTSPALDPVAKAPELKVCAVRVQPL